MTTLVENIQIMEQPKQGVLKNALLFKDTSLDLFEKAVHEVSQFTSEELPIYPPSEYPVLIKNPTNSNGLQRLPSNSLFYGRLAPAEAVGVVVLQTEALGLMQSYGQTFKLTDQVNQIMGTGEDAYQSDAIQAFVEFYQLIAIASGTRELLLKGQSEPTGGKWIEKSVQHWYRTFSGALKEDGNRIGEHTSLRIVEYIVDEAEKIIPIDPGGAKNDTEVRARINGKRRGAELAKALYLETVGLAKDQLPDTLSPRVV